MRSTNYLYVDASDRLYVAVQKKFLFGREKTKEHVNSHMYYNLPNNND